MVHVLYKTKNQLEATPGFEPGNQSFADSCLTTWLCRRIFHYMLIMQKRLHYIIKKFWSGRRGSNPRPMPWQGIALSTELLPHLSHLKHYYNTKIKIKSQYFSQKKYKKWGISPTLLSILVSPFV